MSRGSPFILVDDLTGAVHPLPAEGDVILGRSPACDIVLPHESVTRRHTWLTVSHGSIEASDGGSSGGTYVGGRQITSGRVRVGDEIGIGTQRLTVRLAPWVGDEPPEPLIVRPAGGARVDDAWQERALGWPQDDELWAALYLRWRAAMTADPGGPDTDPWVLGAAAWLLSAPLLQYLRRLLDRDDVALWFVGESNAVVDALVEASHGIGPLLVLDIARGHRDEYQRRYASRVLSERAADEATDVATWLLRRLPRRATSLMGLLGAVFERSFTDRGQWRAVEFLDFMEQPSFAEAAERVVFVVRDGSSEIQATFRACACELISLESTVSLSAGHTVEVAHPADMSARDCAGWIEHLADFEVVQPFGQFSR